MKKAIIFYNGDNTNLANAQSYIGQDDYIICADGGTEHALQLGIIPHTIIGDLDSLAKRIQNKLAEKHITWITFPTDKDATDSELAVSHAIEKGYTNIIIFGLFGSRLDHMLSNIFALSSLEKQGITVTVVEGKQEIRVTRNTITLKGNINDLVSLIPLQGDVRGITTTNLAYPLVNETLYFGYSRGISNVMTKKTAEVAITHGVLLVIHTRI